MSGGLPHSDIHGSKPVPGSPWLNAGYHVLHRLLLPRHPPNALFALDLIQKEQGRCNPARPSQCQKLYTYPCHAVAGSLNNMAVSVLDLEQYRFRQSATRMQHATDPMHPYSGAPNDTDVSLSIRCQFRWPPSVAGWPGRITLPRGKAIIPHRTIKRALRARLMIMCGPRTAKSWWSLGGSNS